jgi:hypothetical protein
VGQRRAQIARAVGPSVRPLIQQTMGIIDDATYTLTCETCKVSESVRILDKGSGWSGSCWRAGGAFEKFHASWTGGGPKMPEVKDARCKLCNSAARVEVR